jgi:tRNA A37 threonylcarbamoyladenosine synthetase subunit TsaC/SUA5/YrdC
MIRDSTSNGTASKNTSWSFSRFMSPVTRVGLLQGSLLRARRYAVRDKETSVVAQVCSFSETHQVLQRLSSKLWPGPVLIYVALDTESTVSPLLQTERSNVAYVALRSPCHPLAVKVCQEYERWSINTAMQMVPTMISAVS